MEAKLKDWFSSFWEIAIHPSEATFSNEAQKAEGKTTSAVGWLFLITIFIHFYNYAVYKYVASVLVILLSFILIPLGTLFLAFCLDATYRKVFHRQKSYYEEFLYLGVIVLTASQIAYSILNLIPAIRESYLLWASYLYPIILLIVAVKSLTRLKVWQAGITVGLSVILTLAGLLCMPAFILSLIKAVPSVF